MKAEMRPTSELCWLMRFHRFHKHQGSGRGSREGDARGDCDKSWGSDESESN
jgi:hypothetical protein